MLLPVRLDVRPFSAFFTHALRGYRCSLLLTALAAFACSISFATQAPSAPAAQYVVVLDAAHGGDDAGASITGPAGNPEAEKIYTLALSVRLRSLLTAHGITVVTTRESDGTLDASRRAEITNHAAAQACLSFHASMSGPGSGSGSGAGNGPGVHLFISSLNPVEPARFVPWKTAQAAWVPRSVALAGVLNSVLVQDGMTVTLGRTALTTIDSMTCPAVVVEVASEKVPVAASGHASADLLGDPAYQAHIAKALADALVEWRTADAHLGDKQP
jgi:N-acetylmuramoyl-L-alanine amidase